MTRPIPAHWYGAESSGHQARSMRAWRHLHRQRQARFDSSPGTMKLTKRPDDECAVCGARRPLDELNIYIRRIYDADSRGHRDYELNYCKDDPSCVDQVEYLPWLPETTATEEPAPARPSLLRRIWPLR